MSYSPSSYTCYSLIKTESYGTSTVSAYHEDTTEKSASDSPDKSTKRYKILNPLERKGLGAKQKRLKEKLESSPHDVEAKLKLSEANYQEITSCYQAVKDKYNEEKNVHEQETSGLKRKIELLTGEVEDERNAKRQKLDKISALQADICRLEQNNRNLNRQLDDQDEKLREKDYYGRQAHEAHLLQKSRADAVTREFNGLQARYDTLFVTIKKQTDLIAEKNRELQRLQEEKKHQRDENTKLQQSLKEKEQKNAQLQQQLSAQSIREAQDKVLTDDLQKELARYKAAFQIGQKIIDGSMPWEEVSKSTVNQ